MNSFVNAIVNNATTTLTENGDVTFNTSLDEHVDMFFKIAAIRGKGSLTVDQTIAPAFEKDPILATRIALWARDREQGAGERATFRDILRYIVKFYPNIALRVIPKVPELGRWDDLFAMMENDFVARSVLQFYQTALVEGNGLAAKWAPRKGILAARLARYMRLTPKAYRNLIVTHSNTVETQMCAKKFDEINYSHVPSLAMSKYMKAFSKNDETRFVEFINRVRTGAVNPETGKVEKINTSVLYPYDVIKSINRDPLVADTQWNNLPDFVPEGLNFLPLIDTSGSMFMSPLAGGLQAGDIAISIGMYLAERNKTAFKNLFLTFESNPRFVQVPLGDIATKFHQVKRAPWQGSTDLDKAMSLIVDTAVANKVPQEEMPNFLLVLSDMEFNGGYGGGSSVAERTKKKFTDAGYKVPNIVWWNIESRGGVVPVRAGDGGMALVSGFSPSIVSALLGGEVTPVSIMLNKINDARYDF